MAFENIYAYESVKEKLLKTPSLVLITHFKKKWEIL